jgi:putative flippase GtrA
MFDPCNCGFGGCMKNLSGGPSIVRRWMVFNFVGAMGICVQIAALWGLTSGLRVHYLIATALAVETAVLHNFFWHERWTWCDRIPGHSGSFFSRLLCFHLTNGALSIAGNLLLMKIFVGKAGFHYMQANVLAIAICSVLNFVAGDRLVFRPTRSPSK